MLRGVQDIWAALAAFDAILMVGSGGCGKTRAAEAMRGIAAQHVGTAAAKRVANSSMVAINAGCETFAHCFKYGTYDPDARVPFSAFAAAQEVAGIKYLIVEEASAISDVRMIAHLRVRRTHHHCAPFWQLHVICHLCEYRLRVREDQRRQSWQVQHDNNVASNFFVHRHGVVVDAACRGSTMPALAVCGRCRKYSLMDAGSILNSTQPRRRAVGVRMNNAASWYRLCGTQRSKSTTPPSGLDKRLCTRTSPRRFMASRWFSLETTSNGWLHRQALARWATMACLIHTSRRPPAPM